MTTAIPAEKSVSTYQVFKHVFADMTTAIESRVRRIKARVAELTGETVNKPDAIKTGQGLPRTPMHIRTCIACLEEKLRCDRLVDMSEPCTHCRIHGLECKMDPDTIEEQRDIPRGEQMIDDKEGRATPDRQAALLSRSNLNGIARVSDNISPSVAELSEAQQSALATYLSITDQEPATAILLLQRSQWNVQVGLERQIPENLMLTPSR